jgi:hypothetical protein
MIIHRFLEAARLSPLTNDGDIARSLLSKTASPSGTTAPTLMQFIAVPNTPCANAIESEDERMPSGSPAGSAKTVSLCLGAFRRSSVNATPGSVATKSRPRTARPLEIPDVFATQQATPAGSYIRFPWNALDVMGYLILAICIAPAIAHTFDLTLLTAEPSRWLQWHQNLFTSWKFGTPYAVLNASTFCAHFYLAAIGLTPVVAQHVATKIPLVAAGLLAGVLLAKLAPTHISRRVRAAWLLSPVVLWVVAGQPQVEPLSIACFLSAMYLARPRLVTTAKHSRAKRRLALAAFVAVIGANFEYFPVAYFVVPVLLFASLRGKDRWEVAWRTLAGAVAGVVVGFPQALLSSTDRHNLLTGLAGTQQTGPESPVKITSSLYLFAHLRTASSLVRFWPELFVCASLVLILIAIIRQGPRYTEELAMTVVAVIVLLSILLDPQSLPQFSAIAMMALLLFVIALDAGLWLALLLPVAGLASWFFQDPWTQFSADVNPTGIAHVWVGIPTSNWIATELGSIYSLGLLGVAAISFARALQQTGTEEKVRDRSAGSNYSRTLSAGTIGLLGLMSVYMATLGAQAAIVTGVTGSTPRALFDAPSLLYNQPFPLDVKRGNGYLELEALDKTNGGVAAAQVQSVISVDDVGIALHSFRLARRSLSKVTSSQGIAVSAWSVTLLAHHEVSRPSLTDSYLKVGGQRISPVDASAVLPHWEFVTFALPTRFLRDESGLPFVGRSGPNTATYLNGSRSGVPYMRVVPLAGTVPIVVDHQPTRVSISADKVGLLRIESPLWRSGLQQIRVPSSMCRLVDCSTFVNLVQWPPIPWEPALSDWRILVLAMSAILITAGIVFVTFRVARS